MGRGFKVKGEIKKKEGIKGGGIKKIGNQGNGYKENRELTEMGQREEAIKGKVDQG